MHTTVGIIGGGPAGLLLSRLLHRAGVDCVVLESRDRAHVERRQRAGILEQSTVDALRGAAAAARLDAEGLVHDGFELRWEGRSHRIRVYAPRERATGLGWVTGIGRTGAVVGPTLGGAVLAGGDASLGFTTFAVTAALGAVAISLVPLFGHDRRGLGTDPAPPLSPDAAPGGVERA